MSIVDISVVIRIAYAQLKLWWAMRDSNAEPLVPEVTKRHLFDINFSVFVENGS